MLVNRLRKNIRDDLECPPELRTFGSGWISGTAGAGDRGLRGFVLFSACDIPPSFRFRRCAISTIGRGFGWACMWC